MITQVQLNCDQIFYRNSSMFYIDLLFSARLLPRVSQLSKPPGLDDSNAAVTVGLVWVL